jgi:predicted lipid-binding transport protein (Tim44 family)
MFSSPIDIVFFAILAAFVAFKLYKVLGRTEEDTDNVTPLRGRTIPTSSDVIITGPTVPTDNNTTVITATEPLHNDPDIAATLTAMTRIDRNFVPKKFIDGARKAFDIIIEAYAKGDKTTLVALLSKEVFEEFAMAIDARHAEGETLETTLIAIVASDITAALLTGTIAHITVKFVTDQVNIIKNAKGAVISGDVSDVERIEDNWTFTRDLQSVNPNWTLTTTTSHA